MTIVLVILLAAAITAIGISFFQSQTRAAEQKRREAVEGERDAEMRQRETAEKGKLHVETLLMQRELEANATQLKTGERPTSVGNSNNPAATSSWDTHYLDHALAQRPRFHTRITTGRWGVVAAAFDDTSRRFAVAHADGELSVWDIDSREKFRQLAKPVFDDDQRISLHYAMRRALESEGQERVEWCTGLAWLADGKSLAAATMSGRGLVFDVENGETRELLAAEKPLLAVAASSDGNALLFGDSAGRVIWQSLTDEPAKERVVSAAETTSITCIAWHAPLSAWIVGDAAGRVQILDGATLETIASTELKGPIWSLDSAEHDQETLIAAGGGEGRVHVYRFDRDTKGLLPSQSLPLSNSDAQDQAAHTLRFGQRGDKLWAIDARGMLIEWDLIDQQLQWTNKAVELDERRRDIGKVLAAKEPPIELPLPFQRMASVILVTGTDSLMTAGDDGLVSLWTVPPRGRGVLYGTTVHEWLVGPDARLVFSSAKDEHLWALDGDGQLLLADVAKGEVVARRAKAHVGTAADITVLPGGVAVTAGGDSELRYWQLDKGKLVAARKSIRHERRLISVTASADGKWLAAVDENSGFGVWRVATGERQFFEQLPGAAGRPLTGRTAFNSQGTWLATFGAGPTGCVFVCREQDGRLLVRRLPDQMNVAGLKGGSALAWNPAFADRLGFADDHPRLVIRSFGETTARREGGKWIDKTVVDIVATPDGRRLLWVDQEGGLVSYDARHELEMVRLESSLRNVTGMAIDRLGQRLAIANDAGTIEIWNTTAPIQSSLPEPKDATARWTATELLRPDSAKTNTDVRTLRFDSQGQVRLLITESHPGDFRNDGALYYLAEDGPQVTRERITIGNPEFDRRMDKDACALHLYEDQPLVVFRCRTAEQSAYDGKLYLARRTEPGVWERELIHEQGNLGFYPALRVDAEGRLTDVFHFTYSGYYLIHSFRQDDGWQAEAVGEQGDGYFVRAWNHDEAMHLITGTNRFNGDQANHVYLQWKPGGGEPLREHLPAAFEYAEEINGLPDGRPVVLQLLRAAGKASRLLTPTENGWKEYQRLPDGLDIDGWGWTVGPDGAVYFAIWQELEERVVLWRGRGDAWRGQILATNLSATPNVLVVRLDPNGRPVVLVGKLYEPFGWLKAFRPAAS